MYVLHGGCQGFVTLPFFLPSWPTGIICNVAVLFFEVQPSSWVSLSEHTRPYFGINIHRKPFTDETYHNNAPRFRTFKTIQQRGYKTISVWEKQVTRMTRKDATLLIRPQPEPSVGQMAIRGERFGSDTFEREPQHLSSKLCNLGLVI